MNLIKYIGHFILGIVAATGFQTFWKRWHSIESGGDDLVPANVEPGPWFGYYQGDWMAAFGHHDVTSAIVRMPDGSYIWATDTPEWDRDWFADTLGWDFPEKWFPYTDFMNHQGH